MNFIPGKLASCCAWVCNLYIDYPNNIFCSPLEVDNFFKKTFLVHKMMKNWKKNVFQRKYDSIQYKHNNHVLMNENRHTSFDVLKPEFLSAALHYNSVEANLYIHVYMTVTLPVWHPSPHIQSINSRYRY